MIGDIKPGITVNILAIPSMIPAIIAIQIH
jgi:hypothetical protein